LAKLLIRIGCGDDGGPFVIGGLIQQLHYHRFKDNPTQRQEVATAFLDEAGCPGAQALSEKNKAMLRELSGRVSPQPSPRAVSK
jgi:hypothetical protein